MHTKAELESLIAEAKLIVARHDGCHNAHNAIWGLESMMLHSRADRNEYWDIAESLMTQLRILDKTGFWPKLPPTPQALARQAKSRAEWDRSIELDKRR